MLLLASIIAGYFFFRREQDSFSERLKQIQDAHDEETKKIQSAREEERRQHEENLKRLRDTLASVQLQYEEEKKVFDEKKKKQVEYLVKKYGKAPDELAKRLGEVTGFKVILPED